MADENAIVHEVEAAYEHYVDAFNQRDAAELARCYDRPFSELSGEHGLSVVSTDADFEMWYEQVMVSAEGQGWARTDIDHLQVWPMSESLAQVVADVTRYKEDGSILHRYRTNYMLRHRDGRWRVLTYLVVEQPYSGPGLPRTDWV